MKLTVIPADSIIQKDDIALKIDLSSISIDMTNWHAVQWADGVGEVEHIDGTIASTFDDLVLMQPFIDLFDERWAWLTQPPSIEDYKNQKLADLADLAGEKIIEGLTSTALGAPHYYGTKKTDQINLQGLVLRGKGGIYPCRDEAGIWARRMHTDAQLAQILDEGTAFIQQIRIDLDSYREAVEGAADHAEVDAVVWN